MTNHQAKILSQIVAGLFALATAWLGYSYDKEREDSATLRDQYSKLSENLTALKKRLDDTPTAKESRPETQSKQLEQENLTFRKANSLLERENSELRDRPNVSYDRHVLEGLLQSGLHLGIAYGRSEGNVNSAHIAEKLRDAAAFVKGTNIFRKNFVENLDHAIRTPDQTTILALIRESVPSIEPKN